MENVDKIREIALNLLKEKGIELIEIIYRREGPNLVLRLIVDKEGGITVDECAAVNERLGELLDKEDFFPGKYLLEVSSPGLDRPLRTKADFERVKGKLVRINTYGPIEDKREHIGKVISCDDAQVMIELEETKKNRQIPLDLIARARLEIEF